jgi:hypothetical protein
LVCLTLVVCDTRSAAIRAPDGSRRTSMSERITGEVVADVRAIRTSREITTIALHAKARVTHISRHAVHGDAGALRIRPIRARHALIRLAPGGGRVVTIPIHHALDARVDGEHGVAAIGGLADGAGGVGGCCRANWLMVDRASCLMGIEPDESGAHGR